MDRRLAQWFATGRVGTSSKAIALWLSAGVPAEGPPSDPSDLDRCMKLLDEIPEWRARIPEMAQARASWGPFAERWEELCALFEEERAGRKDWSAPRTYAFMQQLHGRPDRKPGLHIEIGGR